MKRAVVENTEGKVFRVMLGEHEVGVSKTDFDARFHVNAINDALDVAYLEGQKYLERLVEKARLDVEVQELLMRVKWDANQFITQEDDYESRSKNKEE